MRKIWLILALIFITFSVLVFFEVFDIGTYFSCVQNPEHSFPCQEKYDLWFIGITALAALLSSVIYLKKSKNSSK